MGGSSSKSAPKEDKWKTFRNNIRSGVEDEIARKMMMQREVQMAVNIAKARDTLNYFGSAWLTLVTGSSLAHLAGRQVPPVVGVPIVVGGLVLGNVWDMAYGNKLARVVNEAEYIMEFERGRFVPPKQAAFSKFYTDEERKAYYDESTPVGEVAPGSLLFGRKSS